MKVYWSDLVPLVPAILLLVLALWLMFSRHWHWYWALAPFGTYLLVIAAAVALTIGVIYFVGFD